MKTKQTLEEIELIINQEKGPPSPGGYNILPDLGQSIVIFVIFSALAVFVMALGATL